MKLNDGRASRSRASASRRSRSPRPTARSRSCRFTMAGGAERLRNQDIVRRSARRPCRPRSRPLPGRPGLRHRATRPTRSTSSTFYVDGMPAGHRLRARPVVPPAAGRLPLDRDPDQGDPAQPALDRRPHSACSSASSRTASAPTCSGSSRARSRLRAGLHLHDPVRAVDGLPRLHPHPDQGGARPRAVVERRRRPGDLDHVGHDHQRGCDHGRRVRGIRDARVRRSSSSSGSGWRSRCSSTRRSSGASCCRRRCGCSATGTGGCRACSRWLPHVTIEGELPETDDEPVAAPPAMPLLEGGQ